LSQHGGQHGGQHGWKHEGVHGEPHGKGQHPVQQRLPQQTGVKALYGRQQMYVEYWQQPQWWNNPA
jgi:hypothetical protein